MILVNTDYISGRELETLALVKGSTIQSKHIGKDIAQSFKTLVGGELKAYNEMMNEARALATKRMVAEAEALGADYIVFYRSRRFFRGLRNSRRLFGLYERRPVPDGL